MHISDIALQCASECAQLARRVEDPLVRERLARMAKRLSDAARRASELVLGDENEASEDRIVRTAQAR